MSMRTKNIMCIAWVLLLVAIGFIGSINEFYGNVGISIMILGTVVYQELIARERLFIADYFNIIGVVFLYAIFKDSLF